ncbi:PTS sugar transporter subunit IIA [Breznakia pachnodae]|uniref:PTS sugar transporter subunit IIA n=1 Tax=Breznakia pachnodae TaxID=265178 RepID=UPI0027D80AFE|nr:PTS mannose transporter subunit IIAB [Breznakia pachnodae]
MILASHGELSKGMLNSVQMIIGEHTQQIETFSLYPGESAQDYAKQLIEEAGDHPDTEYIVITDIVGGSIHTALLQSAKLENIKLFSGMNMSLVLEIVLSNKECEIDNDRIQNILDSGKEAIVYIESICDELEPEEF